MTIIFDLDYTLLDTTRFKNALGTCLESCGISSDIFWRSYGTSAERGTRIRDFNPERHIEHLSGALTCSQEKAKNHVLEVVRETHTFLFSDAEWLLKTLQDEGHRLLLITHGNLDWQQMKIAGTGLEDYFEDIVITAGKKEEDVRVFGKVEAPAVMINDNGTEIDEFVKLFPDLYMIAVRGPKPVPKTLSVPLCENLKGVYQEIQKLL